MPAKTNETAFYLDQRSGLVHEVVVMKNMPLPGDTSLMRLQPLCDPDSVFYAPRDAVFETEDAALNFASLRASAPPGDTPDPDVYVVTRTCRNADSEEILQYVGTVTDDLPLDPMTAAIELFGLRDDHVTLIPASP